MSLQTQRQIRENATEIQDALFDLSQWQREMRQKRCAAESLVELTSTGGERELMDAMGRDGRHSENDASDVENEAEKRADKRREDGNCFFRRGNYLRAIDLYTESIAIHPTSVTYANRAQAHLKREEFPQAEKDCTLALELDSINLKAHQRRVVARRQLGKIKEALEDAEMALRLQPESTIIQSTFRELLSEVLSSEQLSIDTTPCRLTLPCKRTPTSTTAEMKQRSPDEMTRDESLTTTWATDATATTPPPLASANGELNRPDVTESVSSVGVTGPQAASDVIADERPHGEIEQGKVIALPSVPKTWAEFEAAHKLLKHRPDLFSQYLTSLNPTSLPSLFKASMSTPVLESILAGVLRNAVEGSQDLAHWTSFLDHLQAIPRYSLLLMCLSKQQKTTLKQLWLDIGSQLDEQQRLQLDPFFNRLL